MAPSKRRSQRNKNMHKQCVTTSECVCDDPTHPKYMFHDRLCFVYYGPVIDLHVINPRFIEGV